MCLTRQRVYVADCDNDRLVVFGKDGSFVGTMGKSGLREGQFRHPVGVCVDSRGRILVADSDNNRIQVTDLFCVRRFSILTERAAATGAAPDRLGLQVGGVFGHGCSDWGSGPIRSSIAPPVCGGCCDGDQRSSQRCAAVPVWRRCCSHPPVPIPALLSTCIVPGWVLPETDYDRGVRSRFQSLSPDSELGVLRRGEMVAVADSLNHRVSVFTSDGLFVRTFGGPKPGAGREGLKCPYSVAVDGNGSLVVGDGGNKRVVVLGLAMTELGLEAEAAADSSDSASYESY